MTRSILPFDVTTFESTPYDTPESGPVLSRGAIGKTFSGPFEGTGTGEAMYCGMGNPADGAGYIVSERLEGTLEGKEGTFVVQHGGLMGPGIEPTTFGSIVPGSGTDQLAGIRGTVTIERTAEGAHTMVIEWEIAEEA